MKRRSIVKLLGGMTLPSTGVFAQPAAARPIRLIVPAGAGNGTDIITRMFAPKLGAILGQPVIVENRAGANGLIGVQEVMRAAPDGNTLLVGSVSSLAINMAMMKNPPYDPRRDLTPIAGAYVANHVWVVRPSFPGRSFDEFIAHAKKNPGKVSVGSASTLVKIQLAALEQMANIELLTVPYKAVGATTTDVLGGTLDMTLLETGSSLPYVKAGKLRPLAVSSPKRNPTLPDCPAVAESIPGFDFSSWSAMVGPAGMAPEMVAKLNAAMAQVQKHPEFISKLDQGGMVPMVFAPEALKSYIDAEVKKWSQVVRDAKIEQE
ncbi:MAG: tripartite tricarboxylate transporter substrate binding protein [Ramlibacter sp.]|jgi:tripartite-type tricarboxylate transporter receptor subunit TctC|nr:tripartite tricarboxylate transporter substrate binding protein [Ramlibacter sp.]